MIALQNKNRVYATLVICIGIVISIWLFQRNIGSTPVVAKERGALTVNTYRNIGQNVNDDWKKLLVSTDTKNQPVTDLTKNNSGTFDETTLTAQMAKDFFAQYLTLAKSGPITPDQANKIAENTLSTPDYTKATGPVYVSANLYINPKTDTDTIKKYNQTLVEKIKNRTAKIKSDPLVVLSTALKSNNDKGLSELDPIILARKGLVSDLLSISVPLDAVEKHLALLNAYSDILSNLEAMRVTFEDPVRGFAGTSQYDKSITSLKIAIESINVYFLQKLGSLQ